MLDGVFAEGDDGILEFHAAEAPSEEEVARLLATIYRRVRRLLARRGLEVDHVLDIDPLAENLLRWPASAARRSRGGSRSDRAPAPASFSSAASRTPPGSRPADVPGAPRGLRPPRAHHGRSRRPRGRRALLPLRASPARGAGASILGHLGLPSEPPAPLPARPPPALPDLFPDTPA